ncbi:MAG: PAS domain-containing protein, partial [Steroidobacteraceae bacterium]
AQFMNRGVKRPYFAALGLVCCLLCGQPALAAEGTDMDSHELITVMDSLESVLFFKDLDGVYRGGNAAWVKLTGRARSELVGKTDFDLFPEEMAASFRAYDLEMMASGESRSNQEWLVYPDGTRVYVETTKAPWRDAAGKIVGLVGICHAISPPTAEPAK